ncbi:hypothetical protein [Thalassobaculum sp.]|uniref:hypothetical protein n=1 Tax=Thalassobaculum sp. TaxID=2022740 RepID=UPI0032EC8434
MSVLHVLEIEALVGLGVFALAYGSLTLLLWLMSRSSEKRQRERAAKRAATEAAMSARES